MPLVSGFVSFRGGASSAVRPEACFRFLEHLGSFLVDTGVEVKGEAWVVVRSTSVS